ncbi:MAG: cation:proton antiporter, partial [Planctomycetaceae bacterium]|nr:cation:proton antiporter [Planctomycetaceae bacterium]
HAADETTSTEEGEHTEGEQTEGDHEEEHGHTNPVTPVLLAIVMILFLAKVGGDVFERLKLPAVLGELVVGILLGNFFFLTGSHALDDYFTQPTVNQEVKEEVEHNEAEQLFYKPAAIIKILAEIGVVLLLFEVGLESTVREMLSVGTSSLLVAVLGVAAPMALGWLVGWLLVRDLGMEVHAFIGATLCATSVGITARVLKDLGRSKQREAQIILGAAVIDDVLGLVILTVVSGVISQGEFHPVTMGIVIGKAAAFLIGAVVLGAILFTRPLFKAATFLRGHGLLVSMSLVICFGFAYLATLVQLEPIVGAFAAGLILERTHYRDLGERENHHDLEEALAPISALLVPIFFVQMGTQVRLESFQDSSVWGLAAAITVMAILGKQVCSLGVIEKGRNRLAVGLGMIPRGEVGLIVAGVGRSLKIEGKPVIDDNTFSAIVVMVMITTMVTPPLLKWALTRDSNTPPEDQESEAEGQEPGE